jgi:hypothetical protein
MNVSLRPGVLFLGGAGDWLVRSAMNRRKSIDAVHHKTLSSERMIALSPNRR